MKSVDPDWTIFDQILAGKIPADRVYEDEDVVAFRDINPQAPIHVLVIPKHKVKGFSDLHLLDAQASGRYFQAVAKVASSLGLDPNGYRVVFNQGQDGQQTVNYLHAHIIGGRALRWPPG
jgi:histidine triad (HIT) family protein